MPGKKENSMLTEIFEPKRIKTFEVKIMHIIREKIAFCLLLCGWIFIGSQFSFAATFTVTNINNSGVGSLRNAIEEANRFPDSDTIEFAANLSGQTITLTGDHLSIKSKMTINGLGSRKLTVRRSVETANLNIFVISPEKITVLINGLTISNGNCGICNNATLSGFQNDSTLTLFDLSVSANNIAIFNYGYMNLDSSLISGNNAGIAVNFNKSFIFNTTVTDNLHYGINLRNTSLFIVNSTISHNGNEFIAQSSAGIDNFDGTAILRNTIVAQNKAKFLGTTILPDISRAVSLGNNLIGSANSGFISQPSDIVGTIDEPKDAILGNLQNNGGINNTRALLNGSPAINAGNNCVLFSNCPDFNIPSLKFDQRFLGFPRLKGAAIDIGAFEKMM